MFLVLLYTFLLRSNLHASFMAVVLGNSNTTCLVVPELSKEDVPCVLITVCEKIECFETSSLDSRSWVNMCILMSYLALAIAYVLCCKGLSRTIYEQFPLPMPPECDGLENCDEYVHSLSVSSGDRHGLCDGFKMMKLTTFLYCSFPSLYRWWNVTGDVYEVCEGECGSDDVECFESEVEDDFWSVSHCIGCLEDYELVDGQCIITDSIEFTTTSSSSSCDQLENCKQLLSYIPFSSASDSNLSVL